ncbi:hypothetical protein TWF225_000251 [Orbilia oligospora]|nr:hypothetical protein TWF225_000251 [Orbilia oligospora]KAF3266465.1 hypothetical protein TWF128_010864 [Orbilia oligospora]KAF3272203.1 hypothetical protein TWF217_004006 [Orbilia oligospora]KAF3297628.1 hypothetical protein TWF132_006041 [Orbilia oligospora]
MVARQPAVDRGISMARGSHSVAVFECLSPAKWIKCRRSRNIIGSRGTGEYNWFHSRITRLVSFDFSERIAAILIDNGRKERVTSTIISISVRDLDTPCHPSAQEMCQRLGRKLDCLEFPLSMPNQTAPAC